MTWSVYILRCADGSYYVGYSNDVAKRLERHNAGLGAKYTRSRRPCALVHSEQYATRSDALKREYQIKQLSRAEKQAIIERQQPVNSPDKG